MGIIGDIALDATPAIGPFGPVIWAVSEAAELFTLGKAWDDFDLGDPTGVVNQIVEGLIKTGRLAPAVGFWFSVGDLIYNLGKGFHWSQP